MGKKKVYKTVKTNPELLVVGQRVQVLMPSKWIGAYNTDEQYIWLNGKIKEVHHSERMKYGSAIVIVRASSKYHTVHMDRLLCTDIENGIRFI